MQARTILKRNPVWKVDLVSTPKPWKTLPPQPFLSKPLLFLLPKGHHSLPGQPQTASLCHSQVLPVRVCSAVELHYWKGVKGQKTVYSRSPHFRGLRRSGKMMMGGGGSSNISAGREIVWSRRGRCIWWLPAGVSHFYNRGALFQFIASHPVYQDSPKLWHSQGVAPANKDLPSVWHLPQENT